MRRNWKILCFVSLFSLLCFAFYSISVKNRDGTSINILQSDVETYDPNNEKESKYHIPNPKKYVHNIHWNKKQQKYKKLQHNEEEDHDDDEAGDNVETFESRKPKPQKQQRSEEHESHNDETRDNNGKSARPPSNGKKYLIYLCMYNESCSGWADRQRAILSGFLLAQVINRTFGIFLTSPCDLRKFLVPNEYNWIVDKNELVGLTMAKPSDSFLRKIDINNFDEAYPQDLVYYQSNRDLFVAIKKNPLHAKSIPEWAKHNKPIAFKNGWNILMKRTPPFDKKFQKLMSNVPRNGQFVCAHVRLSKNPTMPMETRVINTFPSVKHLWSFLDTSYPKASRIFIATDSLDVRKWARRHFKDKEMDTGQIILHIEKQKRKKNACDGFESVLLDQQVMTQCDVLVCSYSNICKHAAYFGDMRENVFLFRSGKVRSVRHTWPEIYDRR